MLAELQCAKRDETEYKSQVGEGRGHARVPSRWTREGGGERRGQTDFAIVYFSGNYILPVKRTLFTPVFISVVNATTTTTTSRAY